NSGRPMTEAISTMAQGIARPLAFARMVSTTWSAPPESASILPRVAPRAISTPTLATVEPSPARNRRMALSSGAPGRGPGARDPMVSARRAWSLYLVMSRTLTAMPARTAMPSSAWPAAVIGSGAPAASISTLSLVTVDPLIYGGGGTGDRTRSGAEAGATGPTGGGKRVVED